jgi:hypothetical protein
MNKLFKAIAACGLLIAATNAYSQVGIGIRIGPPHPIHEVVVAAPHVGMVWQPGYHHWDGSAYVWVPGVWVDPPHPHARWIPPRYRHRHGQWEFHEGHWK